MTIKLDTNDIRDTLYLIDEAETAEERTEWLQTLQEQVAELKSNHQAAETVSHWEMKDGKLVTA